MPVCNQVAARFGLSKGSFWTFFGGLPLKKGILGAGLPGCRGNALARASVAVWRFVDAVRQDETKGQDKQDFHGADLD